MQVKNILVIAALVLFATSPSWAAEVDAEAMPNLIQEKYENMDSFQADFVQELTNIASGEVDVRKGKIWFKQPSRVRWETSEPEKELLIVGPDFAWDYIEEDELAIKYSVESLLNSKTILRFISGQANLKEDFFVKTEWEGAEAVREKWGKGNVILQLTPKEPEPGMVLAFIGVEPDTGLLRQVMIVDFYGNGNEVRLSGIELDVALDEDIFQFSPPEGVIVEDNSQGF
ncbi:Outer-membrane lipoprotein carrier protein [Pseudodesulfovibrio profundus]|uniref:Outer-membrane lipoprotein carrier protein n=1 Tax=Pseudodesulfovibrio profundus TaxID=57320 RepID=A0A2C8F4M8_9BACT|nr:outer membrane lipoprotein carrier protein LolA [Pseudodesulfovibrio profundus]SOB57324.1 Outer-membrane lipoprotein carrier protein [Pseudodesulfovibrio profundus]